MRPIKSRLIMLPNQQYQIYLHEGLIPFAAHPFRSPNGSSTAGGVSQISKTRNVVSSFTAPTSSNGLHCEVFLIRDKGLSHIWPCLGCMENDEPTKCGVRLKTAAKLRRVRRSPGTNFADTRLMHRSLVQIAWHD